MTKQSSSKKKTIRADLHLHTTSSDGTLSPSAVVERAAAAGLNVIAITDHDTLLGVAEAQQFGRRLGVEVIAGTELSTWSGNEEFHIIGLFVDIMSTALLEQLERIRRARRERVFKIAQRLEAVGVSVSAQEVLELAGHGTATRAHVAQVMADNGLVDDLNQAFIKYLGDSGPAFVPKRFMSVEEALAAIRQAGGVSILAHPGLTDRDLYIPMFAEMGLNGLEAYYPAHTRAQTRHYVDMARRLGLVVSGGSDFHGKRSGDNALGRVRVPAEHVRRIRAVAHLLPGSVRR